jgi:hypothetical protein
VEDIVTRLRKWTHAVDAAPACDLMDEAADEIERLLRIMNRATVAPLAEDDIVRRLRRTRADMIGTDDEDHYFDCHDAANEIERLRKSNG